jgi:hypothetical protein
MSSSLTDGLVKVVHRIDHFGYWTSLPVDFRVWNYMRNMGYECRVNGERNYFIRFFMLQEYSNPVRCRNDPDVLRKVQIILNFKYP